MGMCFVNWVYLKSQSRRTKPVFSSLSLESEFQSGTTCWVQYNRAKIVIKISQRIVEWIWEHKRRKECSLIYVRFERELRHGRFEKYFFCSVLGLV